MNQDPKRKNSVTNHMKDFISSFLPSKSKKQTLSNQEEITFMPVTETTQVSPTNNHITVPQLRKELPDYSILGELITISLPNDLLTQIFMFLSPPQLFKCMQVSKRWRDCSDNNRIWKNLIETMFEPELVEHAPRETTDKNWKQLFKEFGIRIDEKNHGTYVRVLEGGRVVESTSHEQYGVAISKIGFSSGTHTLRVKFEIINDKDPKYCYCAIGVLPNSIAFDRFNNGEHSMTQGGGCSFTTYIGEVIYNSSTTLAKSHTLLSGSTIIAKMEIDAEKKSCKVHFSANGSAVGTAELEWVPPFYFAVCLWNGGKFTLF